MINAAQMRAARALLGIDQRKLAELSGVSLPTIQRMEASTGNVRGVVDTLVKVVEAFQSAGIELIGEQARSDGVGRGVRLRDPEMPVNLKAEAVSRQNPTHVQSVSKYPRREQS